MGGGHQAILRPALSSLDTSPFVLLNWTINQSYRATSLRHGSITAEKVLNIGSVMHRGRISAETGRRAEGPSSADMGVLLTVNGNHLVRSFFRGSKTMALQE